MPLLVTAADAALLHHLRSALEAAGGCSRTAAGSVLRLDPAGWSGAAARAAADTRTRLGDGLDRAARAADSAGTGVGELARTVEADLALRYTAEASALAAFGRIATLPATVRAGVGATLHDLSRHTPPGSGTVTHWLREGATLAAGWP